MSERLSTVRLINDRGRVVCEFRWYAAGEQVDPLDPEDCAEEDGWQLASRPPSPQSLRRAEKAAAEWLDSRPEGRYLTPQAREARMEELAKGEMLSEKIRISDTGRGVLEFNGRRWGVFDDEFDGPVEIRLTLPNAPTLRWEKVTAVLDKLAAAFPGQEYLELTVPAFVRCFG
jgi:hypothetical protein